MLYRGGDERGFTLIEVVTAIVILGLIGAAATHLVLRLTSSRDTMIRYEQVSLAARTAAEHVWDLFAQASDGPPLQCLEASDEPPPGTAFVPVDENFQFAFRCEPFVESDDDEPSDTLYRVHVWLRRAADGADVGAFQMLALIGGY